VFNRHYIIIIQEYFPINSLRNVAIDQAQTEFLMLVDIDLLPIPGTYKYLTQNALRNNNDELKKKVWQFPLSLLKLD